jgi:hypothetical protein
MQHHGVTTCAHIEATDLVAIVLVCVVRSHHFDLGVCVRCEYQMK